MGKEKLLSSFVKVDTSRLVSKESSKNIEEEAKSKRDASQFENQTRLGVFFVSLVIYVITAGAILLLIMSSYHVYTIINQPVKLQSLLSFFYSEIKLFVTTYQAVIAAIAGLVFGDIIKKDKKYSFSS